MVLLKGFVKPTALKMAKTPLNFGPSGCNRVKVMIGSDEMCLNPLYCLCYNV